MSATPNAATPCRLRLAARQIWGILLVPLSVRRLTLTYNNVCETAFLQLDIFTDFAKLETEKNMQKAILSIRKKYGKNAILRGMDLEEHGTTRLRNEQIGGHKSE